MYKKLSGMTGTAMTEKDEFQEIYNLDVVAIPTNAPVIRKDWDDAVYKNVDAKYRAVIEQIIECHSKGQPVLVGTVSIDKSEHLSRLLDRRGIRHNVLNAKNHEKEAFIIAQAGKFGAVTIATNMAGRGTDIMLGGNAEYMAKNSLSNEGMDDDQIQAATSYYYTEDEEILAAREEYKRLLDKYTAEIRPEADKVRQAGGLFIIGTERHESRRIDDQLRGRSGRQGDLRILEADGLCLLDYGIRVYTVFVADLFALIDGGDSIICKNAEDLALASFITFKLCHYYVPPYSLRGSMYLTAPSSSLNLP